MPQTAVVIPLYKEYETLTKDERTSILSVIKHLKDYQHVIMYPDNLNTRGYQLFFHSFGIDFRLLTLDRKHFINRESYSDLLKSLEFYEKLQEYDFILIFQTDSYVFRNEMEKWVSKDYDYIGAPWFEGMNGNNNDFMGVGNGGFSLRKVQSFIRISKRLARMRLFRGFWFKSRLQSVIRFHNVANLFNKSLNISDIDNLNQALIRRHFWEDMYWGLTVPKAFTDFKVSGIDDAVKFAFEFNPAYLYELNGGLPFGCHAWSNSHRDFWDKVID